MSWEMRNSNQNNTVWRKTTFNKKIKCQTKQNIPVKFTHYPWEGMNPPTVGRSSYLSL